MGRTPLFYAVLTNNEKVVRHLVSNENIDPKIVDGKKIKTKTYRKYF